MKCGYLQQTLIELFLFWSILTGAEDEMNKQLLVITIGLRAPAAPLQMEANFAILQPTQN